MSQDAPDEVTESVYTQQKNDVGALLRQVFWGPEGIRSVWRWLLYGVGLSLTTGLAAVILLLLSAPVLWMYPSVVDLYHGNLFSMLSYAAIVSSWVVFTGVSGRFLDGGGPTSAGLGGPIKESSREFITGCTIGFLLLVPALLVMSASGEVQVEISAFELAGCMNFVVLSVLLLFAATAEEIVFRGYGFSWFCRSVGLGLWEVARRMGVDSHRAEDLALKTGRFVPLVVISLIFGIVHMGNEGYTLLSMVNTSLAGVWLGIALFRSGAMWLPIGLHLGWNWGQGLLYGLPISGNGSDGSGVVLSSPMSMSFGGPDWLGGGAYGLEGSVGCTIALVIGCFIAGVGPHREGRSRMTALPRLKRSRAER